MSDDASAILGLFLLVIWIVCLIVGIKTAKEKSRSAHWMWFGLHPLGAIIVCIIMLTLGPLKVCPSCALKSKVFAKLCPYCGNTFPTKD